jgi:hypothetical protein
VSIPIPSLEKIKEAIETCETKAETASVIPGYLSAFEPLLKKLESTEMPEYRLFDIQSIPAGSCRINVRPYVQFDMEVGFQNRLSLGMENHVAITQNMSCVTRREFFENRHTEISGKSECLFTNPKNPGTLMTRAGLYFSTMDTEKNEPSALGSYWVFQPEKISLFSVYEISFFQSQQGTSKQEKSDLTGLIPENFKEDENAAFFQMKDKNFALSGQKINFRGTQVDLREKDKSEAYVSIRRGAVFIGGQSDEKAQNNERSL